MFATRCTAYVCKGQPASYSWLVCVFLCSPISRALFDYIPAAGEQHAGNLSFYEGDIVEVRIHNLCAFCTCLVRIWYAYIPHLYCFLHGNALFVSYGPIKQFGQFHSIPF